MTVSPPRTKAAYVPKVQMAHELGFNFVRHHSGIGVGTEYFDAADEWGIMVSPELACVYSPYFKAANATGIDLYIQSWTSYIQVLRNHPSIFDWPMCNEYYMGADLATMFYSTAKRLDPSRLVADSDGACSARSGSVGRYDFITIFLFAHIQCLTYASRSQREARWISARSNSTLAQLEHGVALLLKKPTNITMNARTRRMCVVLADLQRFL